jgi:hypothetical protein
MEGLTNISVAEVVATVQEMLTPASAAPPVAEVKA